VTSGFFARLTHVQLSRPWWVVLGVALSLVPTGWLASRLSLHTSFSELLPDDKPSVVELRRSEQRLASSSTLTIVAESANTAALERFVDQLTPKLAALDPALVSSVDSGTRDVRAFFDRNQALYADLAKLREIHARLLEAYDLRVQRAAGLALDDEQSDDGLELGALDKELAESTQKARGQEPGKDGYYIGDAGGQLAAILVHTPLGGFDAGARELRARVQTLLAQLEPSEFAPDLRVGLTGDLITGVEAEEAVLRDLTHVGSWGVGLVLAVVFLYFLRWRVLVGMGLTILVGCVWSFAAAKLCVGYLNSATGFLVSIVAGNGINFGIVYMARYLEARTTQARAVAESLALAQRETYAGTLAAAAAAAVAYGSLAFTNFRGSRHFGVIGGVGMLLCWLATYLLLPALLVLAERARPLSTERGTGLRERLGGAYGYPFAWLARRAPRRVVAVCALSGTLGLAAGVAYWAHDPMDYNLGSIRNDPTNTSSAGALSVRVDRVVGRLGQDGRAMIADRLDQVQPLVRELLRRRDRAPAGLRPFQNAVSLFDLLPRDQPEKLALLREISERLERAKRRGFVSDADYTRFKARLPASLRELTLADLPERLARPFTEKDGTRGRIVYLVPSDGESVYDGHYLARWAEAFREVRLPNGEVLHGSGEPVILTDMLLSVGREAPRAIAISVLGTLLIVVFAFRAKPAGWLALCALLLGLAWLSLAIDVLRIKLNFLNFIALPISVGVGADYALNMMKRYELVAPSGRQRVVLDTGGAVIVCSLTTTLGYSVLTLSINRAVRSFGLLAAIGEVSTLLAAVLFLPAFHEWRRKRARQR
jgi:hypothetical protein